MAKISIDSILGGQSPLTNFARRDQFRASLGIDPSLGIYDLLKGATPSSGLLRPVGYAPLTQSLGNRALWIKDAPKTTATFVLDASGSLYTLTYVSFPTSGTTFNGALADGGSLSSGGGNGMEYYDNYMYIAKGTDIARYGPLSGGDAAYNGSYWVGTLGKTALVDTQYPVATFGGYEYPNHILHRHSDGRLYILDVQGNQGAIHYIQTRKTSVEGDTDDGSTLNKLLFGYGLWPTAIESYGSGLVIALYESHVEGTAVGSRSRSAKLAFWDTISNNFNEMIWNEFPDEFISAIKNVNGVLYIFSGNHFGRGFRVSRYVGGYSIKEVAYFEQGFTPFPGAVEGDAGRLMFGSNSLFPDGPTDNLPTSDIQRGCVYSLGLQRESLGDGLFVTGVASTTSDAAVYALKNMTTSLQFNQPIFGHGNSIDIRSTDYSQSPQIWQSQVYKIGQPFKITRIRVPLAQALTAGMDVEVTIYFDDGITRQSLQNINVTNFPTGDAATNFGRVANFRVDADGNVLMGQNNFWVDLRWTGGTLCTVSLPIVVEFEVIPD